MNKHRFFYFLILTFLSFGKNIFSETEIPLHKTLKAYQDLRLDVCRDLRKNSEKDLADHLEKTMKFLEKKREKAKGRDKKMFRNAHEYFETVLRSSVRNPRKGDKPIEQAFLYGAQALHEFLKEDLKQLEIKAKQLREIEDDNLKGQDSDLKNLNQEELLIKGGQLPTPEEEKRREQVEAAVAIKQTQLELDCRTLIQMDDKKSFLKRLLELIAP